MNDRFINWHELKPLTGNKSRVTIWRWEKAGLFPCRQKIGPNSVAWSAEAVAAWIERCKAQTDATHASA